MDIQGEEGFRQQSLLVDSSKQTRMKKKPKIDLNQADTLIFNKVSYWIGQNYWYKNVFWGWELLGK